jgi:hypothetical protein
MVSAFISGLLAGGVEQGTARVAEVRHIHADRLLAGVAATKAELDDFKIIQAAHNQKKANTIEKKENIRS